MALFDTTAGLPPRTAAAGMVLARVMLGALFLVAGVGKVTAYAGTQTYMESAGVPGVLLPLVIAVEILAPLALIFGIATAWAALVLCGFTLLSGLLFHLDLADQQQTTQLLKNIAIAGGFLCIALRSRPFAAD